MVVRITHYGVEGRDPYKRVVEVRKLIRDPQGDRLEVHVEATPWPMMSIDCTVGFEARGEEH